MDSKTLLLMLIGGGVAAYLAYSMAKGAGSTAQPEAVQSQPPADEPSPPVAVDTMPSPWGWGVKDLGWDGLCRVAPSLCSWYNPAFVPRPAPGQLLW